MNAYQELTCGSEQYFTETKFKTLEPVWMKNSFQFGCEKQVLDHEVRAHWHATGAATLHDSCPSQMATAFSGYNVQGSIMVNLYDKDRFGKDFLGFVAIPLKDVFEAGGRRLSKELPVILKKVQKGTYEVTKATGYVCCFLLLMTPSRCLHWL